MRNVRNSKQERGFRWIPFALPLFPSLPVSPLLATSVAPCQGSLAIVMDFAGAGDLLHRVDAAKRATKGPLPLPEESAVLDTWT